MSLAARITVERIDAELPQTQCGKCGHDGCRPYAEAIVDGEAINRCPPGGEATRDRLATLTGRPPLPLIEPAQTPLMAVIREAECIGCTKCIQACPVDAILGAARQMHTVLESECTGCELCVAPCPVDCIDLVEHPRWARADNDAEQHAYLDWRAANGRRRFEARNRRLVRRAEEKRLKRAQRLSVARAARPDDTRTEAASSQIDVTALKARRATLVARLARTRKQLAKAGDDQRSTLLERLAGFESQLETVDHQLSSTESHHSKSVREHHHIAIAAANQALRKAQQLASRLEREGKIEEAHDAREQVAEAERHLHRALGSGDRQDSDNETSTS